MRVSTRYTFIAGAGIAAIIALTAAATAGGGKGSCNGCNAPPPPPPSYNPNNGSPCCTGGRNHGVFVPGVNVAGPNISIGGSNVNVGGGILNFSAQTNLNVSAAASASSEVVAYAGGGGGFSGPAPVGMTAIDNLNVVSGEEYYTEKVVEQVPTIEEYCVDEISYKTSWRAVQAVCIDDTGSPHPASQVDGGQSIASGFSGEIYRCVAGSRLQVTIGSVTDGKASFDQGQSMACAKGEALVFKPGGQLSCAPQKPQRDCNERSLLRRHGPGIKVFEGRHAEKVCVPQQRTVMKSVTREVQKVRATAGGSMVFDGGVGQGVY
jgi:hypothetical protein